MGYYGQHKIMLHIKNVQQPACMCMCVHINGCLLWCAKGTCMYAHTNDTVSLRVRHSVYVRHDESTSVTR